MRRLTKGEILVDTENSYFMDSLARNLEIEDNGEPAREFVIHALRKTKNEAVARFHEQRARELREMESDDD